MEQTMIDVDVNGVIWSVTEAGLAHVLADARVDVAGATIGKLFEFAINLPALTISDMEDILAGWKKGVSDEDIVTALIDKYSPSLD